MEGGDAIYRFGGDDQQSAWLGLKNTGKASLYKRGKTLIADNATDVDLEKDKSTILEIKRFSDEYFELVAANDAVENELLANQGADEELIIRLRGKIYHIK